MSDDDDRFCVCATCGRLKHEDLYQQEGAVTCDDCKAEDRTAVNWARAPDGMGFVSKQNHGEAQGCHEANGGESSR